jgi:hypothetical protein
LWLRISSILLQVRHWHRHWQVSIRSASSSCDFKPESPSPTIYGSTSTSLQVQEHLVPVLQLSSWLGVCLHDQVGSSSHVQVGGSTCAWAATSRDVVAYWSREGLAIVWSPVRTLSLRDKGGALAVWPGCRPEHWW